MKIFTKPIILLIFIVFLALSLRLYRIGEVPVSPNWDEVSLGYNAYSILKTGKDEYGKILPLVLRSYDDYKPALYAYYTIPFVAFMGLTEVAVRLPSVTAGVLAVIVVYFLVLELFGKKEVVIRNKNVKITTIALLASLFLAISPWHIQFSRIAFESNVGLTINLLVFLFFLKGIKKGWFLLLSFIIGALNIHMYQSDRVFTPLLLIILSVIFYKKLFKIKKWFYLSFFAFFLVALPFGIHVLTNQNALMRAKGVSVFSTQQLVERSSNKLLYDSEIGDKFGMLVDNRRIEFVKATIAGYISHFDLNWLFVTGDIARHHAPFMGPLYLFELPFLLIGIIVMVFLNIEKKHKIAFFAYFLLVPLPAAITSGVPHAVRTLNFEWTFELFIALGLTASIIFIFDYKNRILSVLIKLFAFVYCLLAFINISYYLNQYFVQLNYYNSSDWLYGYKEAVLYVNTIRNNYEKVIIENEVPFDQSYMFFLFYLKVDPSYYQSLGGTLSGGYKEEHKGFYNFEFKHIRNISEKGKILLVGKPSDISVQLKNRKIIKYLNGDEAIAIAEK